MAYFSHMREPKWPPLTACRWCGARLHKKGWWQLRYQPSTKVRWALIAGCGPIQDDLKHLQAVVLDEEITND